MPTNEKNHEATVEVVSKRPKISLDTWAVLFALAAAALIRAGVLKHIPW
ncbi:MAG: hypothetical protein ABSG16_20230 [Candidatus Acidiferrum sp.]|jgi:hypothetical protein